MSEEIKLKRVAAVIQHPGRDWADCRVDIYEIPEEMPLALLEYHIKFSMLGPFQLMAISERVTDRKGYISTDFRPITVVDGEAVKV
jgi:hypothetical protein